MSIPERFSSDLAEKIISAAYPIDVLNAQIVQLKYLIAQFNSKEIGYVDHCSFPECNICEVAGYRDSQEGLPGYCDGCDQSFCQSHMSDDNMLCETCKIILTEVANRIE